MDAAGVRAATQGAAMRVEGGAVIEDLEIDDVGPVIVRYSRRRHGWRAAFALCGGEDLAVVHSLDAPTLAQARRAVLEAALLIVRRGARPR